MKRIITSLLLVLLLTSLLVLPVSARSGYALDYANLMTREEIQVLEDRCLEIRNAEGLDVVLLTVPSLLDNSPQDFADNFYDNNGYGEHGLLFLLDMGSRQWHISTAGSATDALSDRDLAAIEERVIPYFSEGRYYDGFCRFLDILPKYLAAEAEGGVNLFLSILAGAGIAGIAVLIMRGTMNTKNPQRSAVSYEKTGSYQVSQHQDLFLYSNITKRPRPQNNSSGSSTHRASSGRSHGGRGGRF